MSTTTTTTTTTSTSTSTLAQWLSATKAAYLDAARSASSEPEWTVVMGNEAGDLDSIASSIAFAWLQSTRHNRPSIPLIRFPAPDLPLRKENIHALALAGIAPTTALLFPADLPAPPAAPALFALVDHNRLAPAFAAAPARVRALVDHHADELLYPAADPRVVAPAGSCASLVARLCPPDLPAALATLLLCAIAVDTNGLKPGGTARAVDRRAAAFLVPRSTLAAGAAAGVGQGAAAAWEWEGGGGEGEVEAEAEAEAEAVGEAEAEVVRGLADVLGAMKVDLSDLGAYDLLRRDYKQATYTPPVGAGLPATVEAGLVSVPLRLAAWATGGRLARCVARFMEERGLRVLGVLTSFREGEGAAKKGRGKHRREQLWVLRSAGVGGGSLGERLWAGLEWSGELELEAEEGGDWGIGEGEGMEVRVYKQGNVDATRKVTAPLLRRILEGSGSSV